jgi:hypothetical protein
VRRGCDRFHNWAVETWKLSLYLYSSVISNPFDGTHNRNAPANAPIELSDFDSVAD